MRIELEISKETMEAIEQKAAEKAIDAEAMIQIILNEYVLRDLYMRESTKKDR